jgi:Protein of unknown function (DUF1460)/TAT (twin-arginine translocation) pathway signal sequence
MTQPISRRDLIKGAAVSAAAMILPAPLIACGSAAPRPASRARELDPDRARLAQWTTALGAKGGSEAAGSLGHRAIKVGELAVGSPYEPHTLDAYLRAGGDPAREPLTLSLTRFDCVTLVEACLAVARLAAEDDVSWERFGEEIERMRYRKGKRQGYASRLHYFSEWISDGEQRKLLEDRGEELGGVADRRPLRFMTEHRASYPALADPQVFGEIRAIERELDNRPRRVIPTKRIPQVVDRIESGDVLAFATEIGGLDVSHAAFAYRDGKGILRVLHAPLSGGVVEVTRATLPEYVAAIKRSTGILVARPL